MYVSKNHRQKLLQCQKRIFNIIAYKMAEVLHDPCKTELTDLLNRYEAEPTPEHEAEIQTPPRCLTNVRSIKNLLTFHIADDRRKGVLSYILG